MINFILKFTTSLIYGILLKIKFLRSMSQEGEDLIIDRILKMKNIKYKDIFFLDIGSGHPIKYSNTFYYYIRGSKGICIDAFEQNIRLHKFLRPKDKCFNFLLGSKEKILDYYVFKQSELNTISKKKVDELKGYKIFPLYLKQMKQSNTSQFFSEKITDNVKKINLLNIDIEGAELDVLKSINWVNFKPEIICVEIILRDFEDVYKNDIYKLLKLNGYNMYSKLINSVIFIKN